MTSEVPRLKRSLRFVGRISLTRSEEAGPPQTDFTGWAIAGSRVRARNRALVATVACSWVDAAQGRLAFDGGEMASWPVGVLEHDVILVAPDGRRHVTPTARFQVEWEVTPWAP